MSNLRDYIPGYDVGVSSPTAFTVSYAWNSDHNEAWPAQAYGVPPESRYYCNNNGGKCCNWSVPSSATFAVFEMWGGGSSATGGCCCMQGYPADSGGYAIKSTNVTGADSFTICAGRSGCCLYAGNNYAGHNSFVMGTPTGGSCFCAVACGGYCSNCTHCHGFFSCYGCCMNCYNCQIQPNNVDFGIASFTGSSQRSQHCGDRGLELTPVAPMAQSGPKMGPNGCCTRGGECGGFGSWPGGAGESGRAYGGGCCCGSPGAEGAVYVVYY